MACLDPLGVSADEFGITRAYAHRQDAYDAGGQYSEARCGRCQGCRADHARDWAVRCYAETVAPDPKVRDRSCFVTLTYDEEHVPGNGALAKSDFQKFARDLRRNLGPVRYLHCGEYGTRGRPHYHAILWGHDFREDRTLWKTDGRKRTYLSETLADIWGQGFVTIAPSTFATAKYTAGYVVKKLRSAEWESLETVYGHKAEALWTKQPPYITMSRQPGIGSRFFDLYWRDMYPKDYITIEGIKYRPPEFFDKKLAEEQPVMWHQVQTKRQEFAGSKGMTSEREARARGAIFKKRYALTNPRNQL